METTIKKAIQASIDLKQQILTSTTLINTIGQIAENIIKSLKTGGQVLFCGNGGSAADAQHLAAELSGRFYFDRPPLNAEALHCNTSYLTAVANDYGYEHIYSRMIKGIGRKGDILVGISTSGNSQNVLNAFQTAQQLGITTVALTGQTGGKMKDMADYILNVPSTDTPRIQEGHIMLGHIICQLVEQQLFGGKPCNQ